MKFCNIPERYVRTKSDKKFLDDHGPDAWKPELGRRVVQFCEKYVRPTRGYGADRPARLLPWQADDLITPLFSWINPTTGQRRFREACLYIPRQNGKSFIASAIAEYMLLADGEAGPYVVIAAVSGEQTKIVYDEIHNSVTNHPDIARSVVCRPSTREIIYPKRNGLLKGLSKEGWNKLGRPAHCAIFDEFAFHQDYKAYTAIKTGIGSRKQPLILCISTSGTKRDTPAYEQWRYAEAVSSSLITDPTFFPLVYAAGKDDDIHDERTWKKANPSIGYSLDVEEIRAWSERARTSTIERLNFTQFRLNAWNASVNQFLDLDKWASCTVEQFPNLEGKDAYIGIDLSSTQDLTSVVVLVPHQGRVYVEHHSFCCIETVRRKATASQQYTTFEQEKTLAVHAGNCVDLEAVREHVRQLTKKYNVRSVGIDAAHNAADTLIILQAEGLPVVPFSFSPVYTNSPMRRLSDMVNDGKLAHHGDSLINWQAQNLEGKVSGRELVSPTKPSAEAKIDTMAALIIATAQMIQGEAEAMLGHGTVEIW